MPRRRRVLHYREVPPYFIEPSPPEGATRSARLARRRRPAAFVCETPFETSDFRKSNRRWERNRRRVDCGMHATAYACIPAGGGWSGGGQPSLSFSRLGRVKTPREKIVCPTQTPAPGLPPHPSAATRQNPAPDCPYRSCTRRRETPTFADRLGPCDLSESFGVRSCCWPDSAFQCLGADVVGAVNPLHVRAIRFPPLNDVAARRAP